MFRKTVCLTAAVLALAMAAGAGAQDVGKGKVLFEYWFGGGVDNNLDNLKANANFPNNPAQSEWRDGMDRPDWANLDYFGARGRAFLTPTESGDYTFWTASDDDSEVWLSTDADPANAVMICSVEGWTNYQNWVNPGGAPGTNIKSAPISLVAGQKYYIEMLFSDGTGGGHASVGWAGPGLGATPVVLKGDVLTAFIRDPEPLFQAQSPKPADKAVDVVDYMMFEWTPGILAANHEVYFGTSPELTAADQKPALGGPVFINLDTLEPGKTYYWRVDEIDAAGTKYVGNVWSFTVMPMTAHAPVPADAAKDIPVQPALTWTAGQNSLGYVVFLSKDKAAVTAGDAAAQAAVLTETSFTPAAPLDAFTTYYWRVDAMDMDAVTHPGDVWSFSTVNYAPIIEGQVSLTYNNRNAPFISTLEVATPLDLTAGGRLTDLAIRFQGRAAANGSVSLDETTGVVSLAGAGADIWGTSDQFHFAYKTLNGDGVAIARVVSNGTGTDAWAKGGVMIRQSLDANAAYAIMALTGGNGGGAGFQYRASAGAGAAAGPDPTGIAPPYWVKLERTGDVFKGFMSPVGVTCTQLGTNQTIVMTGPVYIGLVVTSHVNGTTLRTFQFDNISATGDVSPAGMFANLEDVGLPSNDPAMISVSLQDATGAVAAVTNPDLNATQTTVMDLWRVPLSAFAGVDAKNAVKLTLAVGDGQPGGTGVINFADVRTVQPAVSPAAGAIDVTMAGDAVIGEPNDGDWPAAEAPAAVIDDLATTKFLHFKGEFKPTGIIVTPAIGYTVVTGLSFTTANDAAERDPVAFELYGSNVGVDGPWALIATGAIDDFARPIAWPRQKKNVTPIGFANTVPYANYKVAVTAVRAPASANSMQVAEIELLGAVTEAAGPVVFWVSFHGGDNAPSAGAAGAGFTVAADKAYTDLLKANGYNVVRYVQTGTPNEALLEAAANLAIISRSVASGSFSGAAATRWNAIAVPTINLNGYATRKNRLGLYTGNTIPDTTGDIKLAVNDPNHPIFAGIALTDGVMTNPFAGIAVYANGTQARGISVVTEPVDDEGVVLATILAGSTTGPAGATVIAEFPAGATVVHDGGAGTDVLAGHQLLFLSGSREANGINSETAGMYDLSEDGTLMFLNAVAYMLQ